MIKNKRLTNGWYKPDIEFFNQEAQSRSVAIVYNASEWSLVNILGAILLLEKGHFTDMIDCSHSKGTYRFKYPNLMCAFDLGTTEKIATKLKSPID